MNSKEFEQSWQKFQLPNGFDRYEILPVLHEDKQQHHEWSYILHTAWAARILAQTKPAVHYDFSSSMYFSTIVSAFIPVIFYEFQPVDLKLSQFLSLQADLTNLNNFHQVNSVSCLHVLEHLGLGRYGDKIDPLGDKKAADGLTEILSSNGDLLIVVPVGKPILRFNSARTYSYEMVLNLFDKLNLMEFSLIPDQDKPELIRNADPGLVKEQPGDATGCFWFKN